MVLWHVIRMYGASLYYERASGLLCIREGVNLWLKVNCRPGSMRLPYIPVVAEIRIIRLCAAAVKLDLKIDRCRRRALWRRRKLRLSAIGGCRNGIIPKGHRFSLR